MGACLELPQQRSLPVTSDTVFRENYAWLCRWACQFERDRDLCQDIASQAFTEFLRIERNEAIERPRALLKTIARRLVYDQKRRARVETGYLSALRSMPEVLSPTVEDELIILEQLRLVVDALESLSPNARAAFFYRHVDGLTYAEIGARLGVSTSRIQQYMASAFKLCAAMA